ncbi:MAG TPA: sigma-70 family RNA polymerase sigma factor [Methylomirabilota bacterium]|nr:sigma-70 family RNA polymerase sigma factor [Methylomirabilota bacterium]
MSALPIDRGDAGANLDTNRAIEESILKNLGIFVAFARRRLGDHHLAEDVVQDSLIKALAADRQPTTEEETTTWFYRILRRAIIDIYRKQGARSRALERFEAEVAERPDAEEQKELCRCFHRLLPMIPSQYREVLDMVDLQGKDLDEFAQATGVTRNNATVRLHRARKHMRKAMVDACGACSVHGCIDCTCNDSE